MKGYLALDTNIILVDAKSIYNLGSDNVLIIPETVLDEVDSKKSGFTEVAFQAREFGRIITKFQQMGTFTLGNCIVTSLVDNDITINIISLVKYPAFEAVDNHILNDRRIIQAVLDYQRDAKVSVKFMSNDVMCRIRATSFGLEAIDFKEVNALSIHYQKELTLAPELFNNLPEDPAEIDPDYSFGVFSYKLTDGVTGQIKFATVVKGTLAAITAEEELVLRKQHIPPINADQLILASLIRNPKVDVVVCNSSAGSGKTVTAISNAMKLVETNSPYNSIVYIRNSVDDVGEKDEEIGFLSGNEEKLRIYLHPFYDTLETIARKSKGKGSTKESSATIQEDVTNLIEKYRMQPIIATGTRGRTFENAIVILDEAQNMGKATLQRLLTRVGKNSKVIVIGSLKQIDSKYLNKFTSGLAIMLKAVTQEADNVVAVGCYLPKIVRGPITEWAENILSS